MPEVSTGNTDNNLDHNWRHISYVNLLVAQLFFKNIMKRKWLAQPSACYILASTHLYMYKYTLHYSKWGKLLVLLMLLWLAFWNNILYHPKWHTYLQFGRSWRCSQPRPYKVLPIVHSSASHLGSEPVASLAQWEQLLSLKWRLRHHWGQSSLQTQAWFSAFLPFCYMNKSNHEAYNYIHLSPIIGQCMIPSIHKQNVQIHESNTITRKSRDTLECGELALCEYTCAVFSKELGWVSNSFHVWEIFSENIL